MRSFVLAFSLVSCAAIGTNAVTLFEGLRNANASKFADWIQSDPRLVAIYSNPNIKTVFAPTDQAVINFNSTSSPFRFIRRAHTDPGNITEAASVQTSNNAATAASMGAAPGSVNPVNVPGPANNSNVAVTHGTSGNNYRRQVGKVHPIQLFTGLGSNVSVIHSDIPYDGGLIHTVTDFFTLPQPFTTTFTQTGQTSFGSGIATAGLSSDLDNPNGVTIFSVSNEAYAAGTGNSSSPSQLNSLLSNHIIPNFSGYLPTLTEGQKLTTKSGATLTVSIKGGFTYINEAKIVSADLITANGVAHVLDKILAPPLAPFTGAASSLSKTGPAVAAGVISLALAALMM